MSFNVFLESVKFVVDTNEYEIPISNMNVSGGPYSREGGESVAIQAFDGRWYKRSQGWRTRVAINWPEMTGASNHLLYQMITDMASHGSATLVLNPATDSNQLDVVIEDPKQVLKAVFKNGARQRPGSLNLVSTNISASSPDWITEATPDSNQIFYYDSDGKFFVTSADLLTTVEPNPSLDLTAFVSQANKLEYDSVTDRIYTVLNGAVWSWKSDGTGLQQEFDTGHGDIQGIVFNEDARRFALTAHEQSVFNHRFKVYEMDGTLFENIEFRDGSATLNNVAGDYWNGSYYYIESLQIRVVYPNFHPFDTIDSLGAISHTQSASICVHENSTYGIYGNGIYTQSASIRQTGSAPDNDSLVTVIPNNQNSIDWYEYGGVTWLIGGLYRCSTGGSSLTTNWHTTTNGPTRLTCKR